MRLHDVLNLVRTLTLLLALFPFGAHTWLAFQRTGRKALNNTDFKSMS